MGVDLGEAACLTSGQQSGGRMAEVDGVEVTGERQDRFDEVLTPEALGLLARLHREFDGRRRQLLAARQDRYAQLAAGGTLGFLPETADVRADPSWRVAEPAPGLVDRRVEITGPTERKMTINALNSGAKVWLADFEDANTPHWANVVSGHLNLATRWTAPSTSRPAARSTGCGDRAGHHRGPPARLAPAGEARAGRRRADVRQPGRLRPVPGPLRVQAARRRRRSVLLPAEDGEPPRGPAVERRLRRRPGAAGHPPGHHPGDRADRDLPGRVRDGRRSSTSCASTRPGSTPAAGTTCSR